MGGYNDGHRQRLKQRFLQEGLDGFAPHNQLELLLFFAKPQGDTNPLAHVLIKQFGSVSAVMDAPFEELVAVPGVGEHTATLIKLIPDLCRAYLKDQSAQVEILDTMEKRIHFLQRRYVGVLDEQVHVLLLDNKYRMLKWELVSEGDISSVQFPPRRVVEAAFLARATAVVLSHNHPVGYALPSHADLAATLELRETLRRVNLLLVDHIIIAGEEYLSMAASGMGGL